VILQYESNDLKTYAQAHYDGWKAIHIFSFMNTRFWKSHTMPHSDSDATAEADSTTATAAVDVKSHATPALVLKKDEPKSISWLWARPPAPKAPSRPPAPKVPPWKPSRLTKASNPLPQDAWADTPAPVPLASATAAPTPNGKKPITQLSVKKVGVSPLSPLWNTSKK
jgi:hypothetical protein